MGSPPARLSLAASCAGVMLILGDVYLMATYGWSGGFLAGATAAAAIAMAWAWHAHRAPSDSNRARRKREDSFLRLLLPLVTAAAAGRLVYRIGAAHPVSPALVVAAPILYLLLVHFGPRVARRARRSPAVVGTLTFAIAAFAGVHLMGPVLHADWAMVDDHFIVRYQMPGAELAFTQIPRAVMQDTPIGNAQERRVTPRYIPAYYFLQFVEKWAWGKTPLGWYASRLVMFVVFTTLCWLMLARAVGWIAAGLLLAWTYTLPFWADVWCRLGVTESYTATGAAICGFGLLAAWDARRRRPLESSRGGRERTSRLWPWALGLVGGAWAIGSKENFLLLLAPVWLTLGLLAWRRRLPIIGALVGILLTLFAGLIVYQTVTMLASLGADHYGNEVTTSHRARLLVDGLRELAGHVQLIDLLVAAIGFAAAALFLLRRSVARRAIRIEAKALAVLAACAALWLSQYVFYAGKWPAGNRYDFPGVLAVPLAVAAAVLFGLKLLRTLDWDRRILRAARGGTIVGFLLVVASRDTLALRDGAMAVVERNHEFSLCLTTLQEKAAVDPTRPLLFVTWRPWDFEMVHSYRQFLAFRGVTNPMYLTLLGYGPELFPPSSVDRRLAQELATISRQGGHGFRPIGELRFADDAIQFKMTPEPMDLFRFVVVPAPEPAGG